MRLTLREFPERTVVAVLMGPLDREPSTFVTRRRFTLPSFDEKANGDDERGESRETLMTLLTLRQGKAKVDRSLARLLVSSRRSVHPCHATSCHLMPPHATSWRSVLWRGWRVRRERRVRRLRMRRVQPSACARLRRIGDGVMSGRSLRRTLLLLDGERWSDGSGAPGTSPGTRWWVVAGRWLGGGAVVRWWLAGGGFLATVGGWPLLNAVRPT